MKKPIFLILVTCFLGFYASSYGAKPPTKEKNDAPHSEDHSADHHEEETSHDDHSDHEEEGDEHEAEASPNVGPEKGILAASAQDGIKLSPEAFRNFGIRTKTLVGPGPWTIPWTSRFQSAEETNLYRFRDGFFKRIDFTQIARTKDEFSVKSKDLRPGDEIAISGIGFLRITELAAFGGAPTGHSH